MVETAVDYTLEKDELIIAAASQYAVRRLKKQLKNSKLFRLIPKKNSPVSYFIIKRNNLIDVMRFKGIDERRNLKISDFVDLRDETIYPKSRSKTDPAQLNLF